MLGVITVPPEPLDIANIMDAEAREILAARAVGGLVHQHGDIDAAGDQVEQAVRRVLRRKLRQAYYVGHGQIADYSLALSPQLDVVIAIRPAGLGQGHHVPSNSLKAD